jgi:1-acyl-sn-glycerol-3-phosphate acyltransferase
VLKGNVVEQSRIRKAPYRIEMRVALKWMGLVPFLLSFLFASGIIRLLPVGEKARRSSAIRTTSFFSRLMLALLGVRVHVKQGDRVNNTGKPRLIISNHLSYIDVFILSSFMPAVFVTSVELKDTALLGLLASFGGSIFVERRKATGLKKEIGAVAAVLEQGFSVALFPEGTTSNGDRVQQFKNSLFDSAVVTRTDILPVCLRYTKVDGERLTPRSRDAVCYHGGMTFFQHFPKLLSLKSVEVELIPLKTIVVSPHHSRKDLAALAHNAISAAYHG